MDSQNILYIISLAIPVFFAIGGYGLAKKKNRNRWLCFFVCLFTSLLGLLVLACSTTLEYDEELDYTESDVLGWIMLLIGIIWFGITFWYGFVVAQEYNS